MSEDTPIWEGLCEGGTHLKIWADGRTSGFPDRMVMVNRIGSYVELNTINRATNPIISEAAAKANAKHAQRQLDVVRFA